MGSSFVVWGKSVCRFRIGFVHERIPGEAKLFAIVSEIEECGTDHPVLQLPQMKILSEKQRIVGLPAIGSELLYIVDTDTTQRQAASTYTRGPLSLRSTAH